MDFFDPLNEYMDWIYGYMKGAKEEHAIQVLSKDPSQRGTNRPSYFVRPPVDMALGRWINTNVSLYEQELEAGSWLLLSPISLLLKVRPQQTPVITHDLSLSISVFSRTWPLSLLWRKKAFSTKLLSNQPSVLI